MFKTSSKKRLVSLFFTMALMFSFMAPLAQPVAAGSVVEADRLFFCNFLNQGLSPDPLQPKINGDVATWWATYGPAGGVDCIDLAVFNSPETCSLDATFMSYVYAATSAGWAYHDKLTWYELNDAGVVVQYSTTFPVSFPEDHSGGSVQVLINFNSPENQISVGLGADDISHWRTTSRGVEYTVDTDCEQPETTTVLGCSQGFYKNNGYGTDLTLAGVGIVTTYDGSTTLYDVLSNPGNGKMQKGVQTYDGYTRQQVTAYLNGLYISGFDLDQATILAGGYDQAELEYHNHGATGENIVSVCPLG